MTHGWKEPLSGDIVWCYFPDDLTPQPAQKPRPALVLSVYSERPGEFGVQVAYGTSKGVTSLYAGEFAITRADGAAYRDAGLSFDTKFNLGRRVTLPFNSDYFVVPPGAPHGQQPKLGTLHASLMRKAAAAFNAANESPA